ncbi:TonB-dependent receptor [Vibrio sonorensis]|uniref:TonB-dependent receptor n=1 Tax=Vibrio sonorensis TaxID=1004316 RepID=UPI0008D9FD36|nr:TonB-dependent receptor [Vibrio sonorensis]
MTDIRKIGLAHAIPFSLLLTTPYAVASTEATDNVLKVVVVSAQKIEQDKQDIPASLSIYTEDDLEKLNIKKTTDIAQLTPGMNYLRADNHTAYFVYRGIGGNTTMNKIYNINIDGVTIPYVDPNILLDTAQIEVIKGGQGALYGRNTLAGLIKVDTRRPMDGYDNYVQADYGSFNSYEIEAAVGGELGENSAARIAAQYRSSDGYFDNTTLNRDDTNDNEEYSLHAKFDIHNTDELKIAFDLIADSFDSGFDNFTVDGGLNTKNNKPGYNTGDLVTGIFTVEKELSSGSTVKSISSYSDSSYDFLHDWDFSQADIQHAYFDEKTKSFSEELRLHGVANSGMDWLVGAFLMKEELDTATRVHGGNDAGMWMMPVGVKMSQNSTIDTFNAALFGQVIYPVGNFELTGRLRLDYDKKSLDWKNSNNMGMPTSDKSFDDDWFAVLPSASLSWKPTDSRHSYLSVSRGYKAGDYNNVMVDAELVSNAVDPEYSITYEVGHKQRVTNSVELNTALYYIDWTDIQVDVPHPDFQGFYLKQNAAEAHTSGVELELLASPARGVSVFMNAAYLFEYEFDNFANGASGDYTGNKLPTTNDYTVSLGTSYGLEEGVFVGADVSFFGAQYMNEANTYKEDGYAIVNAQIGYRTYDWTVYLYGRNLTDEEYSTAMFNSAKAAGEPRFVGVKAKLNF